MQYIIIVRQTGAVVDYGSTHLPVVPIAMAAEYIIIISAAVTTCMNASHIQMLEYDLKHI